MEVAVECATKRTFDLTGTVSRDALVTSMRELMSPARSMNLVWAVDATGETDVAFRYFTRDRSVQERR
jgi:hypothetical protein